MKIMINIPDELTSEWTPISEKKPENGYWLWTAKTGEVQKDYYLNGQWAVADKYGYEVVAWMPAPKAYEGTLCAPEEKPDYELNASFVEKPADERQPQHTGEDMVPRLAVFGIIEENRIPARTFVCEVLDHITNVIRALPFRHDAARPYADMISAQAAIKVVERNGILGHGELNTVLDRIVGEIEQLSAASACENPANPQSKEEKQPVKPEDILAWLLAYHTKSFELAGRYTPHEVIGWLVHDISTALFNIKEVEEEV